MDERGSGLPQLDCCCMYGPQFPLLGMWVVIHIHQCLQPILAHTDLHRAVVFLYKCLAVMTLLLSAHDNQCCACGLS